MKKENEQIKDLPGFFGLMLSLFGLVVTTIFYPKNVTYHQEALYIFGMIGTSVILGGMGIIMGIVLESKENKSTDSTETLKEECQNINSQNIILMNEVRMAPIKSGQKIATLREGTPQYELGPAVIINAQNEADKVNVVISRVEVVEFGKLTDKICQEEGYSSISEMRQTMLGIYPHLNDNSLVSHVVFSLVNS